MAIVDTQIVSIEYEVTQSDTKEKIDSNVGGEPLIFMVGKGQIIPGLENQVVKMTSGDKADVLVKSEDAYGEYNDEAVQDVPKDQFAGIELTEGMALYGQSEDGGTVQVTVKSINDETCTIDYNHPLAGKELMFSVSVLAVRDASADELISGIPAENAQEASGCCSTDGGSGGGGGCGCH